MPIHPFSVRLMGSLSAKALREIARLSPPPQPKPPAPAAKKERPQ